MHSAKESKRLDHRGYRCMTSLSDDDLANQNACVSIGSGGRAGQSPPKLQELLAIPVRSICQDTTFSLARTVICDFLFCKRL